MKGFGNDIAPCKLAGRDLETKWRPAKLIPPTFFLNDILKQKVGKMDKKRL